MGQMNKPLVIELSTDTISLWDLKLSGKARHFFQCSDDAFISLINPQGQELECQMEAGGKFLCGDGLGTFLLALNSRVIGFSMQSPTTYKVFPAQLTKPDPKPMKNPPKTTKQGSALVTSPHKAASGNSKPKVAKVKPAKIGAANMVPLPAPTVTVTGTAEFSRGNLPAAAPLPTVSDRLPGGNGDLVPLAIKFLQEENQQLIQDIEEKKLSPGPLSDLYLHRQALDLSLSPGFDTLLSLPVVKNIVPFDYQVKTARHVLKNLRGRALLCDEVGLGKTIEAGLIAMEYLLRGLARRILILTPPSLAEQWHLEMQDKFNLDFITYDSDLFRAKANPWADFPLIIASLDTAKRTPHREMVLASSYDLVIVDEAHHLKNQRTQAYQLVAQLKKKYILLLTATPVENELDELFNLINLLAPGQLETATSFKRKYITRGDSLKPKNTEALKHLVREIMVRNRRSDTGAITSRRRAEVVEIELSAEERAFYQRMTTFVRGYYQKDSLKPVAGVNQFILKTLQREVGSSVDAVIPTLEKMADNPNYPESLRRVMSALAAQGRQVSDRAKAEALLRLVDSIPDKVIVFTSFMATRQRLAEMLRKAGYSVAELHGEMTRQQKEDQVALFADDARILVSTETGSEGRNLQFCRVMINYDLPWNPMRIEQRIGRIHRIGQVHDVLVYNLSAIGTVESYILELLDAKINMFQLVVGELDMILGNLKEKKDFEDLIMDIWANSDDEIAVRREMDLLGNDMIEARDRYLAVKKLDEQLLGELSPEE